MGTHQVYLNNETEQQVLELMERDKTLPQKINLAVAVIVSKYADTNLGVKRAPDVKA